MAAVRYAVEKRKVPRVFLCGTSVGGASVVYAAVKDPSNIVGVICENPVAHPERFVTEHMALVLARASPRWFWPVCRFFLWMATNVFLARIGLFWNRHTGSAAEQVKQLTIPILIMHGTRDEIVPLWHGQEMYANAPASLRHIWICDGAWHCALYDKHPDEYARQVTQFVDLVLKKGK